MGFAPRPPSFPPTISGFRWSVAEMRTRLYYSQWRGLMHYASRSRQTYYISDGVNWVSKQVKCPTQRIIGHFGDERSYVTVPLTESEWITTDNSSITATDSLLSQYRSVSWVRDNVGVGLVAKVIIIIIIFITVKTTPLILTSMKLITACHRTAMICLCCHAGQQQPGSHGRISSQIRTALSC